MQVFIEPDGTAWLVYDMTFQNEPTGRAHRRGRHRPAHGRLRDQQHARASIDGVELSDIRPSEYVKPGVEVHLAGLWINPGDAGTLHFEATVPNLLFEDVTNRDLASFQITPTWFGEQYISGDTNVQIAVHLPEGISPDDLLFQDQPFTTKALFEDRAVAFWDFPAVRLTGPNSGGRLLPRARGSATCSA